MSLIRQYRYYGDYDSRNVPTNLTFEDVISANWITSPLKIETHGKITWLRVTGMGGIRFKINDSEPIEITNLKTLEFSYNSFDYINKIEFINNRFLRRLRDKLCEGDFLIVDVIYGQEVKDETDSNIVSLLRQ